MVKDWTIGPWNPFQFIFGSADFDMVPVPPGGVYGDCTNMATLRGQGSWPSAPSQKVFGNHEFLAFYWNGTWTFYDPSYGAIYTSNVDFQQKAVAGFAVTNYYFLPERAFNGRYPNYPGLSIGFALSTY